MAPSMMTRASASEMSCSGAAGACAKLALPSRLRHRPSTATDGVDERRIPDIDSSIDDFAFALDDFALGGCCGEHNSTSARGAKPAACGSRCANNKLAHISSGDALNYWGLRHPNRSLPTSSRRSSVAVPRWDRDEQIFDRDLVRDEVLLDHILHQRLQGRAVWLDPIRPGIAAEHLVDLLDLRLQPRQHRAQGPSVARARPRPALRFNECLVEAGGKPAVLFVQLTADRDQMHDRKDSLGFVKLPLERTIVRKQACDIGMAAEYVWLARA